MDLILNLDHRFLELLSLLAQVKDSIEVSFFHHLLCTYLTSIQTGKLEFFIYFFSDHFCVNDLHIEVVLFPNGVQVILVFLIIHGGYIILNFILEHSDGFYKYLFLLPKNYHLVQIWLRHYNFERLEIFINLAAFSFFVILISGH